MPHSAWRKLTWMNRNWTGKLQITEAATGGSSVRKGVLRNFTKFTGKHMCQSLFFNSFIKKETLARIFSCEFCKTSKNTFFIEHLRATASEVTLLSVYISWKKLRSHFFKASSEEVIAMYSSDKMKAKCMTEYVWKSFFRELAGWHLATSLQGRVARVVNLKLFFTG